MLWNLERRSAKRKNVKLNDMLSINVHWVVNRANEKKNYYAEKRRFPRYGDGQPAFCYPLTSMPVKAEVIDAGLGGLRIRSEGMIRINTEMGIVLFFNGRTTHLLVKVLWENDKGGKFEYGLEYAKLMNNSNRDVVDYIANLKS